MNGKRILDVYRGHALGIAIGMIFVLLLAGGAVAEPYAYITNFGSNNVSVIDTATNNVTATVNVGSSPYGVAIKPDGTRVYVANYGSNNVSVIDTANNTVTATVSVGNNPWGVAIKPDGTRVYVANYGSNNVSVIDTANNTVTATVFGVTSTPKGVAVNPEGTKVYVGVQTYGNGTISVIDTATNNITAIVNVGSSPTGIAIKPDGTRVYVANSGYGSGYDVSVIDTANNTVTAIVNVGSNSTGMAVNPEGTKVYVANSDSNTVSVIDTATNNVTATVNVGSIPAAFGQFIGPAGAQTLISACGSISSPGEYVLTADLSSSSTCIDITSNDVILDGAGHKITGENMGGSYGVYVYAPLPIGPLTNVTVENLTVTNWDTGIYYEANGNLLNNNASNNSVGIDIAISSNNILTGNTANSNNIYGISLDSSNNNTLTGNNASNNNIGIHLGSFRNFSIPVSGSHNTLIDNTANSNNQIGIDLDFSSHNTLIDNTANSNNGFGILLYDSSNITLVGNNASNNYDGFGFGYSSNNNLTNNTANSNSDSGFDLGFSTNSSRNNNNTFIGNTANSNYNYGFFLWRSSTNNTFISNDVSNNTYGIVFIADSSNNLIYNNYFNNTNNAYDDGNNTWSTTKQTGTNIIGGSYLGGNFWSDYAGNDTDGDRLGDTLIPYNSSGNIVNGGDYLPLTLILGVTQSVSNGSTVTTDTTGTGTSASNPVVTNVTTPNAGTVSIQEMPISQPPLTGFYFIGQQVNITAPPANSSSPLNITFQINSSQIPSGQNTNTIQIFKDGVNVTSCTGSSGTASPDPCISDRATLANGDAKITVLTSTASTWNLGVPVTSFIVTKDFRFANVNFTATPAQLGTLLPQNGNMFNVTYILNHKGTVSSTNPGQLYGVITTNGTGIANVTINDTFRATSGITQFQVNPAKLGSGVEVIRVNTTTGNATILTNTTQVTSATVNNTLGTVNLTINLTTPLSSDEKLMIYIKFKTALKGMLPNSADFVNTAITITNLGVPQTTSATINFV